MFRSSIKQFEGGWIFHDSAEELIEVLCRIMENWNITETIKNVRNIQNKSNLVNKSQI